MYIHLCGSVIDVSLSEEIDIEDFRQAVGAFLLSTTVPQDGVKFSFSGTKRRYTCQMDGNLMVLRYSRQEPDNTPNEITIDLAASILNIPKELVIVLVMYGRLDASAESKKITIESLERYARERAKGYLLTPPLKK